MEREREGSEGMGTGESMGMRKQLLVIGDGVMGRVMRRWWGVTGEE